MISEYSAIEGRSPRFYKLLGGLVFLVLIGAGCFLAIEIFGHGITGMNNQVVWGVPHVVAISLLVMASGALNLGSMSTVFATVQFKQFTRFSAFLSIALLAGGLAVLLLDLGRPDRMLLAMLHYNFRSMFSWNVLLYTGFFMLCSLYLWSMFEKPQYTKLIGSAAFGWRLILTTGTGSIFGVIQAREVFHSAITGPTFVAYSLTSGTALSILLLVTTFRLTNREFDMRVLFALRNAMIFFVFLVFYMLIVEKFTKFYSPASYDVENWLLGGSMSWLYWGGVVLIGILFPLLTLFNPATGNTEGGIMFASALIVIGEISYVAHVLLAGQTYPLTLFPGYEVSSSFLDGQMATYTPSLVEFGLGLGGVGIVGLIYVLGFLKGGNFPGILDIICFFCDSCGNFDL
ncbi:MAG: polysulfide reductase NrfD [Magnetococcus sp. DMHC-6]